MKFFVGVTDNQFEEKLACYGKKTTIRPGFGQGAFKLALTDAYRRSYTITEEHAIPTREAACIESFFFVHYLVESCNDKNLIKELKSWLLR
jgi:hypothetical protein